MRNQRARRGRAGNLRRGFTLVELLVVIVVIAVLMGLLLPALNSVRIKAKEATVVVEIKQLESAITAFKAKYGVEPPSRISIYLTYSGWTGDPTSMAAVRQIWPQFDFYMGDPANNATNTAGKGKAFPTYWSSLNSGSQVLNINSGECLFFFLGGVMQDNASGPNQVPTGFSKNPQYPFAPTSFVSNREGPFFEFNDVARIKDIDTSGMNEWYDPLPDQSKPYLYFSSYGGRGYSVSELPVTGTNYTYLHDVYRMAASVSGNYPPSAPSNAGSGSQTLPAQKAQSFQIISPGYDQDYGQGGIFNPKLPNAGLNDSSGKPDLAAYDNLTNFNGGRLNP